ncbi:hypothetical protein [Streptomyces sp. NPDC048636]|uniref:hypothetical protein n=1 Tax=Streptomyces sp. NPDC048636 TaxID=3155762 RepID=UPI0034242C20
MMAAGGRLVGRAERERGQDGWILICRAGRLLRAPGPQQESRFLVGTPRDQHRPRRGDGLGPGTM